MLIFNVNFIVDYSLSPWGKEIKLGSSYLFYVMHILGYSGFSFLLLKNRYKVITGEERTQLSLVFLGTIVAFIFGILFNLIIPSFTYSFIWLGPFFSLFMVILIAYAITKHHLMGVKAIAAELFSGLLIALMFINLFFYNSPSEFWFKVLVFVVAVFAGYHLIKGIYKEVKAREKIENLVEKLEFANLRLKELDQAKSDFVSIASHQLKAPLAAIKGYASMMLEGSFGDVSDKGRNAANVILQSSQNLISIISDFLDIAHIEQGTMEYEFATFDLNELVKEIVNDFETPLKNSEEKSKVIKLMFDYNPQNRIIILADRNKLRQVISNLIDNSIKYTPQGHVKISVSKNESNNTALVKVEDSGIGIAKEMLPNLFRKFSRIKGTSNLHASGSGLGLYVAKEIINAHKGSIWAESEGENKGSQFYVELPLEK